MSAASFDALGTDRVLGSDAYRAEDFPGCEPFHLPASEIEHCEGRLEFWDGVTETAWKVCEPTSIHHEQPSADTSLAGSPTILNRQISTSLTLRDGGSLLMGGLISGNQGAGTTGVPVLSQLPVLGRLFRTDAVQADRTELMVMVTPYVIADHEEGWELTRRIREQFDLHTEIQR